MTEFITNGNETFAPYSAVDCIYKALRSIRMTHHGYKIVYNTKNEVCMQAVDNTNVGHDLGLQEFERQEAIKKVKKKSVDFKF